MPKVNKKTYDDGILFSPIKVMVINVYLKKLIPTKILNGTSFSLWKSPCTIDFDIKLTTFVVDSSIAFTVKTVYLYKNLIAIDYA